MGWFDFDRDAVAAEQDIESREYNIYKFAEHLIYAIREVLSSSAQGNLAEPHRLYIETDGSLHTLSSVDIASGAFARALALYNREMSEFISEGYGIYNDSYNSPFGQSSAVLAAAEAEVRETDEEHAASGGVGVRVGGFPWEGSPAGGAQSAGGGAGGGGAGGAGGGGGAGGPGGGGGGAGTGGQGGQPPGRTTGGTGTPGFPQYNPSFYPGLETLAVGAMSQRVSGPVEVGRDEDKHELGRDRDDNPINAAHFSTLSYFWRDTTNDAPLFFEQNVQEEKPAKNIVRAHLRYDPDMEHPFVLGNRPGLWRFQSRCNHAAGPPGIPPEGPPVHVFEPVTPWGSGGHPDMPVYTVNMHMSPGQLYRPQPLGQGWAEMRNTLVDHPLDAWKLNSYAPVTARVEGYGAQVGDSFVYTSKPGESRYFGGTSNGGVLYLPPELDVVDHLSGYAPGGRPLSTTYHLYLPGVYHAAGYPDMATGGMHTGYRWGTDENGDLTFERVAADGTATEAFKLDAAGLLTGNGGTLATLDDIGADNPWTTVPKDTTETITADTTLSADSDLKFPMLANTKYSFRLVAFTDAAAISDFKFRHSGPAAPTSLKITRYTIQPDATAHSNVAVDLVYSGADINMVDGGGGTAGYIELNGTIDNGPNAGDFEFHWAQRLANGSSASVLAGSYLMWMEIA